MTHADGAAASTAARRRNMKWGGRKLTVRCGRMLMNGDNAMRRKGSFCERRKHARCVHAELQQPSEVEVVATSAVLGRDAQRRRSGRTCSCSCAAGDELEVQSSPPLAPLMGEKHEGEEKEGEHGIDMRAASSSAAMELDDDAHEGGDKKTMGVGMFQSESEADGPPRHGQRRTTAKFKIVRVFSGLVAGAIGAFVTFSGGTVFGVFICTLAAQFTREFSKLVSTQGALLRPNGGITPVPKPVTNLMPVLSVAMVLGEWLGWATVDCSFVMCSVIVLVTLVVQNETPAVFEHAAFSIFGIFYCGLLPAFWLKLRSIAALAPPSWLTRAWPASFGGDAHITVGLVATVSTAFCIVAADVGAYYGGKNMGQTPLTPVSPKKTVEGAVSGLVASMAMACGLKSMLCWPQLNAFYCMLAATLFFGTSIVGDLVESIMKRGAGVKDTGDIIPGHGGLLDRFDSWILTGPASYFISTVMLPAFAGSP